MAVMPSETRYARERDHDDFVVMSTSIEIRNYQYLSHHLQRSDVAVNIDADGARSEAEAGCGSESKESH